MFVLTCKLFVDLRLFTQNMDLSSYLSEESLHWSSLQMFVVVFIRVPFKLPVNKAVKYHSICVVYIQLLLVILMVIVCVWSQTRVQGIPYKYFKLIAKIWLQPAKISNTNIKNRHTDEFLVTSAQNLAKSAVF